MNYKLLFKAIGIATVAFITTYASLYGMMWLFMKMPLWLAIPIMAVLGIAICTFFIYQRLKIKSSLDE